MSYKRGRYTNNNQNWLFFHPTVGDSWTHLIEKEYWAQSEDYEETEERELESERPKETKLVKKLTILAMTSSILLLGIAAWMQIPRLQEANLNMTEKLK